MKVILDAPQLRQHMIARGWDQAELGRRAGISGKTVAKALSGDRPITLGIYGKINRALRESPGADVLIRAS